MDLKDQKYMAALAGEGSLTRAARRLNLSQPALSKWLGDLEQELGLSLVIRSRQGLIFTEAGQIYLEGCRECLEAALDIRRKLDALSQKAKQSIILGGSPIRGAQAFAKIYPDFRHQYPDIDLQFVSDKNPVLKKLLLEGEITMSLLGAMETSLPGLEYLKFMDEELLLMLPKGHPLSYDYKELPPGRPYPVIDLASLGDTPILGSAPETSYGNMVLSFYRNAGLEPNIIFRSNVVPLLYEMVLNGVGAAMIPDSYYNPDDGISVYSLSPRIIVYQGIGLQSGYPLSEAEEYLIHLVMNNWGSPYYMHQYADYYLEQRKLRIDAYEYNQI
ncbi:LysR family transcriptional regulator [Enterocloster sp. OA13]|uniref:LysR family transcriptional regulator n=1 Tax=Enterocloster hominis (ex Hitch et al. 2024) TaxID=1917870 RepID=A0ABV1DE46_9FIRM|nr:LysR substrate binding domain protein [Clostridiales bacterium 1_7_47FAA]MCH1950151.1 LysR family transcriptional regulator [Enterocloster sp. OA13]RJW37559.1 LysR family transcriptional regulator [Clostridiales bacterium TF09-2AC]